eukprot:TRINITY_DN68460_c0_g1_i1.p1 TRINITY_DN68460_c0_g1~~TRINITY_DN68460_c0_g1_i1.p1  ORF type:complete len:352 (+),score=45.13 TRINITY_DN68460_c0_g1_i1:23-1057(+)
MPELPTPAPAKTQKEKVAVLKKRKSVESYRLLKERNVRKNKQEARYARLQKGLSSKKKRGRDQKAIHKTIRWLAYRNTKKQRKEKESWKKIQRENQKKRKLADDENDSEPKAKRQKKDNSKTESSQPQPTPSQTKGKKLKKKSKKAEPWKTRVSLVTRVHAEDTMIPLNIQKVLDKYDLRKKGSAVLALETPEVHSEFVLAHACVNSSAIDEKNILRMLKSHAWVKLGSAKKPLNSNVTVEQLFGKWNIICIEDMAEHLAAGGEHFHEITSKLTPFHMATDHTEIKMSTATKIKIQKARDPENKTKFGRSLKGFQQHDVQGKKPVKIPKHERREKFRHITKHMK